MDSLHRSALLGVFAYISSFAAIWYYLPDGHGLRFPVDASDINIAAWFHYSANHVSIVESLGGAQGFTTGGVNLIAQTNDSTLDVLFAFPIIFCVLFGALACAGSRGGLVYDVGALAGGYASAMVIGAFIFSLRQSAFGITARVGPSYMESAIFGFVIAACAGFVGFLLYAFSTGNVSVNVS